MTKFRLISSIPFYLAAAFLLFSEAVVAFKSLYPNVFTDVLVLAAMLVLSAVLLGLAALISPGKGSLASGLTLLGSASCVLIILLVFFSALLSGEDEIELEMDSLFSNPTRGGANLAAIILIGGLLVRRGLRIAEAGKPPPPDIFS